MTKKYTVEQKKDYRDSVSYIKVKFNNGRAVFPHLKTPTWFKDQDQKKYYSLEVGCSDEIGSTVTFKNQFRQPHSEDLSPTTTSSEEFQSFMKSLMPTHILNEKEQMNFRYPFEEMGAKYNEDVPQSAWLENLETYKLKLNVPPKADATWHERRKPRIYDQLASEDIDLEIYNNNSINAVGILSYYYVSETILGLRLELLAVQFIKQNRIVTSNPITADDFQPVTESIDI